jgi:hypothetical protein
MCIDANSVVDITLDTGKVNVDRRLCGIFFEIRRNGKTEKVCFSDMNEFEMNNIIMDRSKNKRWWFSMAKAQAKALKRLGDQCEVVRNSNEPSVQV